MFETCYQFGSSFICRMMRSGLILLLYFGFRANRLTIGFAGELVRSDVWIVEPSILLTVLLSGGQKRTASFDLSISLRFSDFHYYRKLNSTSKGKMRWRVMLRVMRIPDGINKLRLPRLYTRSLGKIKSNDFSLILSI